MAIELFDNATSSGTSTTLELPATHTDSIINVRSAASTILQQNGQFRCIIIDPTTNKEELILVTGGQWTAQWQVVRGIERTQPQDFPAGSIVRHVLTAGALANLIAQGGVITPPPPGTLEEPTVDTNELYKIILFHSGLAKGIPAAASPPDIPTNFALSAALAYVSLTWDAPARAATYQIYRDGSIIASGIADTSYIDSTNLQTGNTYQYKVQAVDQYGQTGVATNPLSAAIDASQNHPPTVSVTAYPNPIPAGGTAIIRVNAKDPDVQSVSMTLGVNAGSLRATADPSIWLYTI